MRKAGQKFIQLIWLRVKDLKCLKRKISTKDSCCDTGLYGFVAFYCLYIDTFINIQVYSHYFIPSSHHPCNPCYKTYIGGGDDFFFFFYFCIIIEVLVHRIVCGCSIRYILTIFSLHSAHALVLCMYVRAYV